MLKFSRPNIFLHVKVGVLVLVPKSDYLTPGCPQQTTDDNNQGHHEEIYHQRQ